MQLSNEELFAPVAERLAELHESIVDEKPVICDICRGESTVENEDDPPADCGRCNNQGIYDPCYVCGNPELDGHRCDSPILLRYILHHEMESWSKMIESILGLAREGCCSGIITLCKEALEE